MKNILDTLDLKLATKRLILEPVQSAHAVKMCALLSVPDLHRFVPTDPPGLEALTKQYSSWERRLSPQGDELWLNWIARSRESGDLVGHFQAGMGRSGEADIAYTVGKAFQRQGFAKECLTVILNFLFTSAGARTVKALVDTRNVASLNLLQSIGLRQRDLLVKADFFKGESSDEFSYSVSKSEWDQSQSFRPIRRAYDADVPALRLLVNEAYKELADLGLNFTGTFQDEAITRKRMDGADVFVIDDGCTLLASINLSIQAIPDTQEPCLYINQLAVRPEHKKRGLGASLLDLAEDRARALRLKSIRLDTAMPAKHLVDLYQRRGYRVVDEVQWEGKTYRSFILEKSI